MRILDKPFGRYLSEANTGVLLLVVVGIVRFLLKPVFQIPYERGTNFASLTILVFLLMVWYSVKAARSAGTYRDVLGIAAALSLVMALLIIISIAIDDFGGIDTYYTDAAHGGGGNPLAHMGGHAVGALVFTLALWAIGSVILRVLGASRKAA